MLIFDSISLFSSLVLVSERRRSRFRSSSGDVALLELLVEFFLSERGLHLGQLGIDVFVAGGEIELGCALLQDLVIDHLMQNVEADDVCLLVAGLLRVFAK